MVRFAKKLTRLKHLFSNGIGIVLVALISRLKLQKMMSMQRS